MLVFCCCCCSLELSFLTLTNRTLCLFGKFFGRGLVGVAQKGGGSQVWGGISRIVILVVEGRTTRSFFFENSEQENYGSFFYTFLFSICVLCELMLFVSFNT